MRVTGSMRLIKKCKNVAGGACVKNLPRVERPTMVVKKQSKSIILNVSLLQPTCGLFLWDHVTDCSSLNWLAGHMRQRAVELAQNCA